MGKGFKSLVSLGLLGGAAFGGYKAYREYEYLKETHNNLILFNGEKLIYDDVFEGDSIAAVAAGVEVDLREAEFDADYTNLDLYGFAAGFKIMVPEDVKVVVNGVNKASGIQVNVDESIEGKVLNITYDMTASGLLVASSETEYDEDEIEDEEGYETVEVADDSDTDVAQGAEEENLKDESASEEQTEEPEDL